MFNRAQLSREIRRTWNDSPPLTATSALMLAAFVFSVAGIFLDGRIITGAPAWLKPAKFGISTAIFTATVAWLFRYITIWRPFVQAMGWILSAVIVLEVAIIDAQAARGTTSHFNVSTPLDAALFGIMGIAIAVLWFASVGVSVALFRQKFTDPAWGWALRLGMLITVLGSAAGGLMIRNPRAEAKQAGTSQIRPTAGGHTVGAPDGGAGLPGVDWSTRHGDLRIPHFFGMHGVQVVPFLAWLLLWRRTRSTTARIGEVAVISGSYLIFVAILLWQALRGQSIVQPDAETGIALGLWFTVTVAAFFLLRARTGREHSLAEAR